MKTYRDKLGEVSKDVLDIEVVEFDKIKVMLDEIEDRIKDIIFFIAEEHDSRTALERLEELAKELY